MKLTLKLLSPQFTYTQDNVQRLRVPAVDGVYEFLPDHAPAFMALGPGKVTVIFEKDLIREWLITEGTCTLNQNIVMLAVPQLKEVDLTVHE